MKRKERGRERIENKDRKGRGKRHKKEKKKKLDKMLLMKYRFVPNHFSNSPLESKVLVYIPFNSLYFRSIYFWNK